MILKNKIALITGASGSIGGEIAKVLHQKGAHVIISGSNEEKLQKLAAKLQDNYTIKKCQLNDFEACKDLIVTTEKLDILVCNAGITRDNLAIKMSDQMFDQVIDINLKANFILNREAIKKMLKSRWGRIINISSVVAVSGNPGQANYCAAKAGIIGMTKSLAYEVASRNITINNIAPGFVKSDMTDQLSAEQQTNIMQKIPLKRFGSPVDIAHGVAFLASEEAAYITGQTLHINGGMLMI